MLMPSTGTTAAANPAIARLTPRLIAGGTTTKRLRPAQKARVARNIITAGMPKAQCGP